MARAQGGYAVKRLPPFQAMSLDAYGFAEAVGFRIGQSKQFCIGALMMLWDWCRRRKTDVVTEQDLWNFFPPHQQLVGALASNGFLKVDQDGLRVLGAEDWLNIPTSKSEAGSLGGKAAAALGKSLKNLIPGARTRSALEAHSKQDVLLRVDTRSTLEASGCNTANSQQPDNYTPPNPRAPREVVDVGPLQKAWNENTQAPLHRWVETPKRRRAAAVRALREHPVEEWVPAIRAINACHWTRGDNKNGWIAGPDFFLKQDTWTRWREGAFAATAPPTRSAGRATDADKFDAPANTQAWIQGA